MAWQSTDLAAFVKPVADSATAFLAEVTVNASGITKVLDTYDTKILASSALLTDASSFLGALNEAGMYSIFLSPKTGGWYSRLSRAKIAGELKGLPAMPYSTGMAVLTMVPSLPSASAFMTTLTNTLTATVPDMNDISNVFDTTFDTFSDLLADASFDIDIASKAIKSGGLLEKLGDFSADEWKSLTMGDILGGTMQGVAGAANNLSKELKNVLAMKNKLLAKQSGVGKVQVAFTSLLSSMTDAGAYCITLPPGPGKFLERLKNEVGAPNEDPSLYCCGMVSCAIGPDAASLGKKWSALSKLG